MKGFKLVEGINGLFVGFPSQKGSDDEYRDTIWADKELKDDIDSNKTELIMKLMIIAAIYEFMFMHKTPVKVVIAEYLKVSDFFVKSSQKSFLKSK